MKKLFCIVMASLLLSAVFIPAQAASLPAKAAKAIAEAGWEGYKAATVYTKGPSGMVYALMRKGDQNLFCILKHDTQSKEYRLLAANENFLPPGKIMPKFTYHRSVGEFFIEYSIKKPAPGQPAKVVLSFFDDGIYVQHAEFTYPAGEDQLFPRDDFGITNSSLDITHSKIDKRGDYIESEKRVFMPRESWVYFLPSFSLEQALSDIAAARSGSYRESPPPLLVPFPADLMAGVEAGELIQFGDRFVDINADFVNIPAQGLDDISRLAALTAPESMNLADNRITGLALLAGFTSLRRLYLNNNEIDDIAPLAGLPQLEVLQISGNPVKDLTPLAHCVTLLELAVSDCDMNDLSVLGGLKNLQRLTLRNCTIGDLSLLTGLKNLTSLSLDGVIITDLSPLQELTALERLWLHNNQITDLESLKGLTKLGSLLIEGNPVTDLSPLNNLTALYELYLSADTNSSQVKELKRHLRDCKIYVGGERR